MIGSENDDGYRFLTNKVFALSIEENNKCAPKAMKNYLFVFNSPIPTGLNSDSNSRRG